MNGPVLGAQTVILNERVWGRLATVADDRGVSIEDVLEAAIESLIKPATVEDRVLQLVRAGYPDRIIAGTTGLLLERVRTIRRKARLAPNKYRGDRDQGTPA